MRASMANCSFPAPPEPAEAPPPSGRGRAFLGGEWTEVARFERERLGPGTSVPGPCLVLERHSATPQPDRNEKSLS